VRDSPVGLTAGLPGRYNHRGEQKANILPSSPSLPCVHPPLLCVFISSPLSLDASLLPSVCARPPPRRSSLPALPLWMNFLEVCHAGGLPKFMALPVPGKRLSFIPPWPLGPGQKFVPSSMHKTLLTRTAPQHRVCTFRDSFGRGVMGSSKRFVAWTCCCTEAALVWLRWTSPTFRSVSCVKYL